MNPNISYGIFLYDSKNNIIGFIPHMKSSSQNVMILRVPAINKKYFENSLIYDTNGNSYKIFFSPYNKDHLLLIFDNIDNLKNDKNNYSKIKLKSLQKNNKKTNSNQIIEEQIINENPFLFITKQQQKNDNEQYNEHYNEEDKLDVYIENNCESDLEYNTFKKIKKLLKNYNSTIPDKYKLKLEKDIYVDPVNFKYYFKITCDGGNIIDIIKFISENDLSVVNELPENVIKNTLSPDQKNAFIMKCLHENTSAFNRLINYIDKLLPQLKDSDVLTKLNYFIPVYNSNQNISEDLDDDMLFIVDTFLFENTYYNYLSKYKLTAEEQSFIKDLDKRYTQLNKTYTLLQKLEYFITKLKNGEKINSETQDKIDILNNELNIIQENNNEYQKLLEKIKNIQNKSYGVLAYQFIYGNKEEEKQKEKIIQVIDELFPEYKDEKDNNIKIQKTYNHIQINVNDNNKRIKDIQEEIKNLKFQLENTLYKLRKKVKYSTKYVYIKPLSEDVINDYKTKSKQQEKTRNDIMLLNALVYNIYKLKIDNIIKVNKNSKEVSNLRQKRQEVLSYFNEKENLINNFQKLVDEVIIDPQDYNKKLLYKEYQETLNLYSKIDKIYNKIKDINPSIFNLLQEILDKLESPVIQNKLYNLVYNKMNDLKFNDDLDKDFNQILKIFN